MSLFLDVSIKANSIVEAAWARATANRERTRRRLDVQAVREEVAVNRINGRGSGLGWELRYTTPTPTLYKADEPVAYPVTRQQVNAVTIGRAYFFQQPIGGDKTHIWSGNGLQRLTFDGITVGGTGRVYPLGGAAMMMSVQFESATFGGAPTIRCFRIDHTSVREVSVPSGINNDSLAALGDRFNEQFGWAYTQAPPLESVDGIFTPAIYLAFASLYPSLHPAPPTVLPAYDFMRPIVEAIKPGLREIAIVTNDDVDPYINNGAFVSQVNSTGYQWTGPDPPPGIFTPVPLGDPPWRAITVNGPAPSNIPIIPDVPTSQADIGPNAYYVWDWNDPAYCRTQLLALGFSTGDLVP